MNQVEEAILRNELPMFLIGSGLYKCMGRSDQDEPTDYLYCWESEIIPFLESKPHEFYDKFLASLCKLLIYEKDVILGIYSVANHIFWCLYFIDKGVIKGDVCFDDVINRLFQSIELNKSNLIKDKRWAGSEWNSKQGLFEPLQRLLSAIFCYRE